MLLQLNELKINSKKCSFGQDNLEYLGHVISAGGVSANLKKLEAMTLWPTPKDVTSLRGFLDLTGYYIRSLAKKVNEKLSPMFYGPFQVLNRVGAVAYKLDLPSHSKIHPVFHVSLLKKAVGDSFQSQPLPPMLSEAQELQVYPDSILDIRELLPGNVKILIQWQNLPTSENSWESVAKLQEAFPDFHLEDKVSLLGGGIDKRKPPITKVYTRRQRGNRQQQGTQYPRGANHPTVTTHPKGCRVKRCDSKRHDTWCRDTSSGAKKGNPGRYNWWRKDATLKAKQHQFC